MHKYYRVLKWDTDFFGFNVAELVPRKLITPKLIKVLLDLKKQNISLVYWASDPCDEDSQRAAKECNGFLADRKITYELDLESASINSSSEFHLPIEEYTGNGTDIQIEDLVLQSGVFSRFKVDPKISRDQFVRLYKTWALNSINKTLAEAILVAKQETSIIGLITVSRKKNRGKIKTLVVDSKSRGKRVGTNLIERATQWLALRGCKSCEVITQGDNVAACRLYEKAGFKIKRTDNFYHFWL